MVKQIPPLIESVVEAVLTYLSSLFSWTLWDIKGHTGRNTCNGAALVYNRIFSNQNQFPCTLLAWHHLLTHCDFAFIHRKIAMAIFLMLDIEFIKGKLWVIPFEIKKLLRFPCASAHCHLFTVSMWSER